MKTKHPMQPLEFDEHGVIRFKQNKIVRDLLDFASKRGFSLNEIGCRGYDPEDQMQLAQLIGYSFSGYADLSYVTNESYDEAHRAADGLREARKRSI